MNENPRKYLLVVILALLLLIVAALVASGINPFIANWKYSRLTPSDQQLTAPHGEANKISIPSLNIEAPILYAQGTTEDEFQKLLIDGVVHYPGTADPGQVGNCYIFGHSSDFIASKGHYKTVFATLPHIQVGAQIHVTDQEGNAYTYVVKETKVVAANDVSVLNQGDGSKKLLTVQTSYPVGTALKRFVVVAELK